MNCVYPITKDEESGEILIIDDAGQTLIGFNVYIPCEYLKEMEKKHTGNSEETLSRNVVSFSDFRKRKSNS